MQRELSAIIGRRVDLQTANGLSPHFRQEALEEAEGGGMPLCLVFQYTEK